MARKRRRTLSRNPVQRFKMWDAKLKPEIVAQYLEATKPLVRDKVLEYQVTHEWLIQLVRNILAKYGKDYQIMQEYMWFAEKLWRLIHTYKGKALQLEADALYMYYLLRGRDDSILRDIALALGVKLSDPPTILDRVGITVGVVDITEQLEQHRTKVPIDHPESSILFAHLAKEVKEEFLRLALSTLMNRALLNAETKDFYIILADVRTADYPNGYYGTIITKGTRTPITITEQSGNDLTDYAIRIELDENWDGWGTVIDGSDIYFLDSDGNPLYYWIEEFSKDNKHAIIWVKIPSIPANSNVTIYMCYGGDNPYSSYNDPSNVFLFWDDFSGADIDVSKWLEPSPIDDYGGYTLENSYLVLYKGTRGKSKVNNGDVFTYSVDTFVFPNLAVRFKMKATKSNEGDKYSFYYLGVGISDAQEASDRIRGFGRNDQRMHVVVSSSDTVFASSSGEWDGSLTDDEVREIAVSQTKIRYIYNDEVLYSEDMSISGSKYIEIYMAVGDGYNLNGWGELYIDWVIVRKYVYPEPDVTINMSEAPKVETTNLQFPDGIDKILVTIDSDAQEAYFSTDGGQTWNPLTLDEEILLPETATQLKLKFANLSYFRGYALVGW